MNTFSYIKAGLISILIVTVIMQNDRIADLKIENQDLQKKISHQPVQDHIFTFEDLLNHVDIVGNIDTVFSRNSITRDVNHWVPGKTKTDTITTKYVLHVSVTEDLK